MKFFNVLINGQQAYEYDKENVLEDMQLEFLDKMDRDMERGIRIRGELISEPDARDKAKFVALNLIKALQQSNEAAITVSCAYLNSRIPSLLEVQANDSESGVQIEFVQEH